MTFTDLSGDQQVVPESVMQDLLSMEDERMSGDCRVPPIYNNINNNCNYNLPQSVMQYTDNGFSQALNCGDFQTFGDMEDLTLNYHVNGPLRSPKEPEYIQMDYNNIPASVSNCSTTIKQEPKEYTQNCCELKKDLSYNQNDHKVSFTELDQILNCDLTFYDDMNFGVQTYKEDTIKVEYDSDPESCHSHDSDQESGLGENFDRVQSEVIRQVKKDIEYACTILNIPAEPRSWSVANVQKWISYIVHQYKLPMVNLDFFQMNGLGLTMIAENDFKTRSPEAGATLFAHLDIWLNASKLEDPHRNAPIPKPNLMYLNMDQRKVLQELTPVESKVPIPVPISVPMVPSPVSSLGSMSPPARSPPLDSSYDSGSFCSISSCGSEDEAEIVASRPSIHLWQFLKELLMQPQFYGNCIRWLDRKNGVFKIEDSARVARLWGKRKNRPAMNYDKLSRSIRQYYKKGIIKKTENSKRLVYRFCHPYLL